DRVRSDDRIRAGADPPGPARPSDGSFRFERGHPSMSALPIRVSPARARVLRRTALAVVILVALALPFLLTKFTLFQASLILALAIGILGLNLLVGYGGQISLGHGFFIALGGYTSAILM